eukprot:Gb_39567 [translate_table: standard]
MHMAVFNQPTAVALLVALLLGLLLMYLLPTRPSPQQYLSSFAPISLMAREQRRISNIWSVQRLIEWKPCEWWKAKPLTSLPEKSNGYIKVDCYGGLNQMRRDLCDGVGIARLLNATLLLPNFEVAAYWNDTSDFADIFDVDYFIQQMEGFVHVVKELPEELAARKPVRVDCRKRKGHFDYIESVLPALLEHQFIVIAPAMSQRSDRYPLYAKVARCRACFKALHLVKKLEHKGAQLLDRIPQPFLSLHLRFEPDMIAYSQCQYSNLSQSSVDAIDAAREGRIPWSGDAAVAWRNRGKCPLTPKETAFMLQALGIPVNTSVYLAAGDGLLEKEGFTGVYTNSYTKSSLLDEASLMGMRGNSRAALDYYVSINSDAYVATYFGNMDKMVAAMRALRGLPKTLFLNRKAFAEAVHQGLHGKKLAEVMWETHRDDFSVGRGSALPDCFCQSTLIDSI